MLTFDPKLSTVVESATPIRPPSYDGSVKAGTVEAIVREAPAERPLAAELLEKMHRYWCAANYLSVGQIYLMENPLLREPLAPEQIKPRLLGHFGTTVGLNFIYVHLNRAIRAKDANM